MMWQSRQRSGHQRDQGRFCHNDIVDFVGAVGAGVGVVFIGEG
jgi:hypothetical protein